MGALFLLWMVTVFHLIASTNAQCAKFQFPTIGDPPILTVTENTEVTVPFLLDTTNCTDIGSFTITVSMMDKHAGIPMVICKLAVRSDKLMPFSRACTIGENGSYSLTIVDLRDMTQWIWSTSKKGVASDAVIQIEVLDSSSTTQADHGQNRTTHKAETQPATKLFIWLTIGGVAVTFLIVGSAVLIVRIRFTRRRRRQRGQPSPSGQAVRFRSRGNRAHTQPRTARSNTYDGLMGIAGAASACPDEHIYSIGLESGSRANSHTYDRFQATLQQQIYFSGLENGPRDSSHIYGDLAQS